MPGQIGNKGNAKAKIWSDAIRKEAIQSGALEKGAKKLIELMLAGDPAAIREFGDRIEGKAHQSIDATLDASERLLDVLSRIDD